ncbi:minor capsid protein [uncultured Methanobacterium sp.]|uniref:minor capsid protein n=1 Tax=uncultured Methanobacterium sp. TaxID=176306 RepID=UPI002803F0B4|nr:minor capsid protein [uncultured Methanobacterium sp.]
MIVECVQCGKEYQLESGENVFDFQCECGGNLKETYQKEGSVSLGIGVDFSELESMVKTITKDDVFEGKVKGTHVGETKEITKDQINDYKDENIDNEDKTHIKSILKQSIDNQKGMRWAISEMINNIDGMTREKAESIARTETVRARNQAELVKAKNTGKEYFIVISAKDCCDECYNTYNGKVFSAHKNTDKLPPLHKKCRCTASFFRSESLAKGMAEDISKPR